VGEGRIIESTGVANLWRRAGDLSFHQVLSTLRAPEDTEGLPVEAKHRTCSGTGASIVSARTKAIVEAVERHASGIVRIDWTGTARQVTDGPDVRSLIHLSSAQIDAMSYLGHFDPDLIMQWSAGRDVATGRKVLLPVDFVNYPLSSARLGRPLLTASNSSGIASHIDEQEAIRRGFLELMERHAVLTSWHSQSPPRHLTPDAMTAYLAHRVQYWSSQGYDLHLLDFSLDGIPIAGVALGSSKTTPGFAFGSGASQSWHDATVKALHEAEAGIAGYRAIPSNMIQAADVSTPLDHGQFHAYDPSRIALTFLSSGVSSDDVPVECHDLQSVMTDYEAIAVRIDSPEPIKTCRVISPHVLPISFGYELEHRPVWSRAPHVPHFIA